MPEIGEVARVVNYIHKHLVGKTLAVVKAQHDENVFGKVGCSAQAFEKALTGKRIINAKQQGKYFWMEMSSPPHPLMHFGMTGWFKIRDEETAYYKSTKPEKSEDWPPKYWKFALQITEEPGCEAAFVDSRRFSRIRLLDCAAEDVRKVSPLIENGPDPVIDKYILTEEWLGEKLASKKIPVKALLLDQANISGIGNWVGDEILYDARIHPEQYSNTLSPAQVKQLHSSIHYICGFAVDSLADSSKFPDEWLFKHRWSKGKKDSATKLPNGAKFVFLTVGGRTSCVVPGVQKKTGPVAKDFVGNADEEEADIETDEKPAKGKRDSNPPGKNHPARQKAEHDMHGEANGVEAADEKSKPTTKKRKSSTTVEPDGGQHDMKKPKNGKSREYVVTVEAKKDTLDRRRSSRVSSKDS